MGHFRFHPAALDAHELDRLLELAGHLAGPQFRTPVRRLWLTVAFVTAVEKAMRAVEDRPALGEVALELPDFMPDERAVLAEAAAAGQKFEATAPGLARFFEALAEALAEQGRVPTGAKAPGRRPPGRS
jgi:hypothetical protein